MTVVPYTMRSLDEILGVVVGLLLAVTIHGEARAFFGLLIQKPSPAQAKIPFRFNPIAYLDVRALPVMVLAGWGWTRPPRLSTQDLKGHWSYPLVAHLAGSLGNLVLAGVVSTLHDLLFSSAMFKICIAVNLQFAVANFLIPLPPLAVGRALALLLPGGDVTAKGIDWAGALVLTGLVVWEVAACHNGLAAWTGHLSAGIYGLLMGGS
ncbi:hypothetical protein SAMN02746041_03096 [Desulfacinum hydrothermale DSM 13146]|uniref:Peptidase family M50 n=1 Tax=Desulfacinum hydrothermale DSM 13146 TaxID=1121390 RepID=A0A1W1XV11_9BACT|nr:hypothetical protein [Desulfacinum hydrothermale]SMC27820.1 hypothetical protein SAMN02746041_03096 [Desulfacinum hydrothermale DSM 13146]